MSKIKQIIIITGVSGGGKTTALKAIEDLGFYSVDNLPISLIPVFIDLLENSENSFDRIVLGIDVRENFFLNDLHRTVKEIKLRNINLNIIFLDANDKIIIRRFKETRRKHPMGKGDIKNWIKLERDKLNELREIANFYIDTSKLSIHQLKKIITDKIESENTDLIITLISFGFSKGIPVNADLVFNARTLTNPYFFEELKDKTGLDSEVKDFLSQKVDVSKFIEKTYSYIDYVLSTMGKNLWNFEIGVGCTGGKHRSVYIVEVIASMLKEEGYNIEIIHRDYMTEAG